LIFEGNKWSDGKGVGFVMSKMQSRNAIASVSELARIDQIGSASVVSGKIIEFEIAKNALEQGHQGESKQFATLSVPSRLPNLAADDWLDWTALGALFVAVTLIPVLSVILFR
jgi:hypothetical protein